MQASLTKCSFPFIKLDEQRLVLHFKTEWHRPKEHGVDSCACSLGSFVLRTFGRGTLPGKMSHRAVILQDGQTWERVVLVELYPVWATMGCFCPASLYKALIYCTRQLRSRQNGQQALPLGHEPYAMNEAGRGDLRWLANSCRNWPNS
jgi:hypothetical protein